MTMTSSNETSSNARQGLLGQHAHRGGPPSYPDPPGYSGPYAEALPEVHNNEESAGRRFIEAFVIAVFLWVLLGLLVESSLTAVHWTHWYGGQIGVGHDYNIPASLGIVSCVQGDEWEPMFNHSSLISPIATDEEQQHLETLQDPVHWSKTSFKLPLSSETLFFVTRGKASGTLQVMTSPYQEHTSATVNVWIVYEHSELRDLTKACLISREEGESGVGVFAPTWKSPRPSSYTLRYQMMIILPELSTALAPLLIKNFETDIPDSAHLLQDFNGKVHFDTISLRGSNAFVKAKSLTAKRARIQTSNYGISGNFTASQELVLEGSSCPIKVNAYLKNDGHGSSSTMKALTTSGEVQADVRLLSTAASGGSFDVEVETTGSPLQLRFPASPVGSKLKLKAKNTRGSTIVSLNPAYEGKFRLLTSGPGTQEPIIYYNPLAEDPSGQGRKRHIASQYSSDRKEAVGSAHWGDEESANGMVDVRIVGGSLLRLDL